MSATWGRFMYRRRWAVLPFSAMLGKKGDARLPVRELLAGNVVWEVV